MLAAQHGAAWATLSVALLLGSSAMAQGPETATRVGVLPPVLGQGVPQRLAKSLRARILAGLERGEGRVIELSAEPGCDTACQVEKGQAASVGHVIRFEIVKAGPDFNLTMTAVDVENGELDAKVDGTCEICGDAELEARTSDLAASLESRLENVEVNFATLSLKGKPVGATVFVDGEKVGKAPFEGRFDAGKHEVEVRHPGYAPQTRTWAGARGVHDDLEYALTRAAKRGPRSAGAFAKPLGWTLVGAGAAALGTGIGLMLIDERAHPGTCQDDLQDADGDCPFRYNTQMPGIVSIAVGVAAAGAGAGLLVWHKKSSDKTQAQLRVTPTSVSATVRF